MDKEPDVTGVGKGSEATTSESPANVVACFATGGGEAEVLLATALVEVESKTGDYRVMRALLDQGAQASFITEATAQYLGLKRIPIQGQVSGIGGTPAMTSKAMVELKVKSLKDPKFTMDLLAYVLPSITSLLPSRRLSIGDWKELHTLGLADPEYHRPNRIDMLLGAEIYGQVIQEGLRKGPSGTPVAQSTAFGWILSGSVDQSSSSFPRVMHVTMHTDELLKKFWEIEAEPKTGKIRTEEEKLCEEIFDKTTTKTDEGRYIVKLPFRDENPKCREGESRFIAERRLKSLEYKLNKNPEAKKQYSKAMDDYLNMNHMELVPEEEINKPAVYLPHHAVIREDKDTTKTRVVFDASCKYKNGVSLNDDLMIGPTIQADLRHLLMRWRGYPIILISDVQKMYLQVLVAKDDIDYQRLLWRDESGKVRDYRMLRVTFGTASAPYLAVRAMQQTARDAGEIYPEARKRILNDFYMDDLISGCNSVEEGEQIYKEINELLNRGGFKTQKWSSSSEELMEKLKECEDCEENLKESLKLKMDETIKTLGLTWNRRRDEFEYEVHLAPIDEPVTKRKVISAIATLFDPLGWIAPIIIQAKVFIQKIWLTGIDWDERLPQELLEEWKRYQEELDKLTKFSLPRWMNRRPEDTIIELHGFSDASEAAYAGVVYVRVVDAAGMVHVHLVASKTKVAPIKQLSIPRLELCAAVLMVKLLAEVAEVLEVPIETAHAWTDSQVVLAWLSNHPSRWKTFIANRVSEIMSVVNRNQWSHVRSQENPADCASRGISTTEFLQLELWRKGPTWLGKEKIEYPELKSEQTKLEERSVKVHTTTVVNQENDEWWKFSSLRKLLRVMAYCRRWLTAKNERKPYLTKKELGESLDIVIRKCQNENFDKNKLEKDFKSLNCYVDENRIIRIGGRLEEATISFDEKHPILIPKNSKLTNLLVADAHERTLHGGNQATLSYLRRKFWLVGSKNVVKAILRRCVVCAKAKASVKAPFMGQLPPERVTPAKVFLKTGVDYAGPISVRSAKGRGHHAYKGYICLFVCMVTRAVHIELVSDLTSAGFLAAFKRFVARRGPCAELWSDNGTNFVGAATELKVLFKEESNLVKEVAECLENNGTEWHFIPPHSPNFGGLWEAGVKSVKYHLVRVIGNSTLTFEELTTVLAQIEACLNSRPISCIQAEEEQMPLTPGHFLVGQALVVPPDCNLEQVTVSPLRRWHLCQQMVQQIWRKWSREYLDHFMHRYKWSRLTPEPKVGDIALVKEDNLPPAKWLLGRVVEKHTGRDNVTRVVTLKCKNGLIKRPVSKLSILPVHIS